MPKIANDITKFLKEQGDLYLVSQQVQRLGQAPPAQSIVEICNRDCFEDRIAKYLAKDGPVKQIQVCKIEYGNPPILRPIDEKEIRRYHTNQLRRLRRYYAN